MNNEALEPVYRVAAGAEDSAVVLHVPHSSRALTPAARAGILLDDHALAEELDHLTDAHTDLIATRAAGAAASRPWLFLNRFSRLVVDPERFPDEREDMRAVGMGAVYTRTSHNQVLRRDDPAHEEELLARHYRPHAAGMAGLVDDRLARTGAAVIIDVHSYPRQALPYERDHTRARPPICLGTDSVHTPQWLVDAAMDAFAPCGGRGMNTPFAGCYVPLRHHGRDTRVTALMVEIRRDLYLTEPGGVRSDGLGAVADALTGLLDSIAAHLPRAGES